MIEATQVSKYFGETKALDALDFNIEAGEIVGLVGKNGAGKSTALRIFSCQLLPSSGNVRVDGISLEENPREVRRRIGFLPEEPPLYREMSVKSYLEFAAGLRGLSSGQARERSRTVMGETSLEGVAGERLGNLSRGYQQRVGIAQAIVHDPKLVLLDEPMAGLDPLQISQARALIKSLGKRHTVLFSSHILSEITNVCDRVILIDEGKVRAEGSEDTLWERFHHHRRISMKVRGTRAAIEKALKSVKGVTLENALPEEDGVHALTLEAQGEVREQLSAACVKAQLGLLEIRTERHGLEDLFVRLIGEKENA